MDYPFASGVGTVAIGDLNGDGLADLVALPYGDSGTSAGSLSVLLNNGDGTFAPGVEYPTGLHPFSVVIADLNGDGHPDLAVTTLDSYSEAPRAGTLVILLNKGDGTFAGRTDYETGVKVVLSLGVGDLDGDGSPDLAGLTARPGEYATISVYLNDRGSFPAPVEHSVGGTPCWLSIADLDRDGKPDLVVGDPSTGGGSLTVLLNTGPGTFEATTYDAHVQSALWAVGDLDGDGHPDLVIGDGDSGVDVLLNQGRGTFPEGIERSLGASVWSVALGDVNGDGRLDLLALTIVPKPPWDRSSFISMLPGLGDGTFGAQTNFPLNGYPISVTVGDLNGDGMPDIALGTWSGVSVLLNQCR